MSPGPVLHHNRHSRGFSRNDNSPTPPRIPPSNTETSGHRQPNDVITRIIMNTNSHGPGISRSSPLPEQEYVTDHHRIMAEYDQSHCRPTLKGYFQKPLSHQRPQGQIATGATEPSHALAETPPNTAPRHIEAQGRNRGTPESPEPRRLVSQQRFPSGTGSDTERQALLFRQKARQVAPPLSAMLIFLPPFHAEYAAITDIDRCFTPLLPRREHRIPPRTSISADMLPSFD